ncbi:MAG: hypothetical protein AAFQ87_04180 [Bacteroidota bacterium]
MKTLLIRLSFLPFALAIIWGAKTLWQQIEQRDQAITQMELMRMEQLTGDQPVIQLALALDVSGSMEGLIDQAQTRIWSLVNELATTSVKGQKPHLELALYAYGGDHFSPERGFVRQLVPFTTDLDQFSEALFALKTNGGEEYSGAVIDAIMKELAWNDNPENLKLLFVAGNESFLQGTIDPVQASKLAHEQGVTVNTIYCGPFGQGRALSWHLGAEQGGGQFLSIDHNLGLEDAPTPFDDQFGQLNARFNETYVYYGDEGRYNAARTIKLDGFNSSKSTSAMCNRTTSKANYASSIDNKSWDLVEAAADSTFQWAELDYKTLPEEFRNMKESELQAQLQSYQKARAKIQQEILEITKKRQDYLSTLQKSGDSRLDDALIQCVQKQAKAKGYDF